MALMNREQWEAARARGRTAWVLRGLRVPVVIAICVLAFRYWDAGFDWRFWNAVIAFAAIVVGCVVGLGVYYNRSERLHRSRQDG